MSRKKTKEIDPVELKKKIQSEMHNETKSMTTEQKMAFYKKEAGSGSLGKFWKQIQSKPSKKAV